MPDVTFVTKKYSVTPNVNGDSFVDRKVSSKNLLHTGASLAINSLSMGSLPLPTQSMKYSNATIFHSIVDIDLFGGLIYAVIQPKKQYLAGFKPDWSESFWSPRVAILVRVYVRIQLLTSHLPV